MNLVINNVRVVKVVVIRQPATASKVESGKEIYLDEKDG